MNGEGLFARALSAFSSGDLGLAGRLCDEVLAADPRRPDALNLLAVIANMSGDPASALGHLMRATSIAPDDPLFWLNRGGTLRKLGRYAEAIGALDEAVGLAPQVASVWLERGLCLMDLERFDAAAEDLGKATALAPENDAARLSHAVALHFAGHLEAAIAVFQVAIARSPKDPDLAFRFGLAYQDADRHDLAAYEFERAIRLAPGLAKAHIYRGISLNNLGRPAEALASFCDGLRLDPADARTYWYCGKSLHRLGRDSDALVAYTQSIERNATNADALNDRGYSHFCLGDYAAARADYDAALRVDPANAPTHVNLALLLLLQGDLVRGWAEYEWRWKLDAALLVPRRFDVPMWNGEVPAPGMRILLHGEQGLGDTIQFCRYAPLVAARGFEVVLEADPPMADLLRSAPGTAEVVTAGTTAQRIASHCPLMSLPRIFATDLAGIPSAPRYLAAPDRTRAVWQARLGPPDRLRVGLAWRGNPRHLRDAQRSIPLSALAPLMGGSAEFFSLQNDVRPEDAAALASLPAIRHFKDSIGDLADVAALCELMDLVIAVDTSVAHLAGALGRPVWLLLPFVPDWRWLLGRNDSPWYPSARLYRQASPGAWAPVIERMRVDIEIFATGNVG